VSEYKEQVWYWRDSRPKQDFAVASLRSSPKNTYAFGLDMFAQRCDWQFSCVTASAGVFGTGTGWPISSFATIMAVLGFPAAG
jgi:hypothetical protein